MDNIEPENFLDSGGRPAYVVNPVAGRYRLVMHGGLTWVGSTDPVNFEYLGKRKRLAAGTRTRWLSDHLCWTAVAGLNTHDRLPLPDADEALRHFAEHSRPATRRE